MFRGIIVIWVSLMASLGAAEDSGISVHDPEPGAGAIRYLECPAVFDLPRDALDDSWVTRELSNYRCEFHGDVRIEQLEVASETSKLEVVLVIAQDEGTDKQIDLELRLVEGDDRVLSSVRNEIELDEGETTRKKMRLPLPRSGPSPELRLKLVIHGIGWG